jgi:type III secretion system low calcium response chaperone LcrH/SycD
MNHKLLSRIDVRDQTQVEAAAVEVLKLMKAENKTFHEVLGLSDGFIERLYAVAYSYYNQGKYSLALDYFRLLSTMDTKNSKFFFGLASTLHQLKEYDAAGGTFMMALCLEPSHPLPAYYAADAYLKDEQIDMAKECLEVAIEISSDHPEHAHLKERCLLILKTLKNKKL